MMCLGACQPALLNGRIWGAFPRRRASACLQVKLMRQVRVEAMHRRAGAGSETLIGATACEKGSNVKVVTGRPPSPQAWWLPAVACSAVLLCR